MELTVVVTGPTVHVTVERVEVKKKLKALSLGSLCLVGAMYLYSIRPLLAQILSSFKSSPSQCDLAPTERKAVWAACGVIKSETQSDLLNINGDYAELNLSYITAKDITLVKTNLGDARIKNSNFHRMKVYSGSFNKVQLTGNTILGSLFIKSNFSNSEIIGNLVENTNFYGSNFNNSFFHGSRFINCDFEGASFRGANLADVTFLLSNLKGVTYDSRTKLPFSQNAAEALGMIYVE